MQNEIQRSNFELLYDSHILLAMCYWRMEPSSSNSPLQAVKNFKLASRYKQWAMTNTAAPKSTKELLM